MSSRTAYTALTPEVSEFGISQFTNDGPISSTFTESHGSHPFKARWNALTSRVLAIIASNTGLLLIAASQLFFTFVNVAVKKLNSIDPPIPALEVRMLHVYYMMRTPMC